MSGKVRVGFYGKVDIREDLIVVGPCWRREVDGLIGGTLVELGEEESAEMDSAGAGDCLEAGDLDTRQTQEKASSEV